MAMSQAPFGILHGIKVSVRNSLHYALITDIGVDDWYQHGMALTLLTITFATRLASP